jgi:hypothetical protein
MISGILGIKEYSKIGKVCKRGAMVKLSTEGIERLIRLKCLRFNPMNS